jgi:hypothetical protein
VLIFRTQYASRRGVILDEIWDHHATVEPIGCVSLYVNFNKRTAADGRSLPQAAGMSMPTLLIS